MSGETAEMHIYCRNKFGLNKFRAPLSMTNTLKLNKIKKGDELYGLSTVSAGYSLVRKIYARYPDSISFDSLF